MSGQDFECKNTIFGPSSNVKIGFGMSKYDIRPQFECQNKILNDKLQYLRDAILEGEFLKYLTLIHSIPN